MRVLRVFPRRTSYTPTDEMVAVGEPGFFRPAPSEVDEVHVSATFSWDRKAAERLAQAWAVPYPNVQVGGPAFQSPVVGFTAGLYVRQGVTFTTRGCNNHCPWCIVPELEGPLRLISEPSPGHILQDNNLLQAPRSHVDKVFRMLRRQGRGVDIKGGLDARLVDDWVAEELRGLAVRYLFLSCDYPAAIAPLRQAARRLSFLDREHLRCYVMVGRDGETVDQAIDRLVEVYAVGCMPFAMLYQPLEDEKRIDYGPRWRRLQKLYTRPALTKMAVHGKIFV